MAGNAYLDVNFKVRATMDQYPSKTLDNYFTISLKNLCATNRLEGASTQAAINYEDGSNSAESVTGFTYTSSTTINADCNITHEILFRDTAQDVWSTTKPAYISGTPDSTVLSFTIQTSAANIATAGDITASRWVKRRHYNPHSGQEIIQEIQVFFYKSLYCRAKTAALVSPSTLNLANAVVGTSKTISAQLDTNSGELVTTANDASHCNYSATCQIFDTST